MAIGLNRGGQPLFITPTAEARRPFYFDEVPITALYGMGRSTTKYDKTEKPKVKAIESKNIQFEADWTGLETMESRLVNEAQSSIKNDYDNSYDKWAQSDDYNRFIMGLQKVKSARNQLQGLVPTLGAEFDRLQNYETQIATNSVNDHYYVENKNGVMVPVRKQLAITDDLGNEKLIGIPLTNQQYTHSLKYNTYSWNENGTVNNPELNVSGSFDYDGTFKKELKDMFESASASFKHDPKSTGYAGQLSIGADGKVHGQFKLDDAMSFMLYQEAEGNYDAVEQTKGLIWDNISAKAKHDITRQFWEDYYKNPELSITKIMSGEETDEGEKSREYAQLLMKKINTGEELNSIDLNTIEQMQKNYTFAKARSQEWIYKANNVDVSLHKTYDIGTGEGKEPKSVSNLLEVAGRKDIIEAEGIVEPANLVEQNPDGTYTKKPAQLKVITLPQTAYDDFNKLAYKNNKANGTFQPNENVPYMKQLAYIGVNPNTGMKVDFNKSGGRLWEITTKVANVPGSYFGKSGVVPANLVWVAFNGDELEKLEIPVEVGEERVDFNESDFTFNKDKKIYTSKIFKNYEVTPDQYEYMKERGDYWKPEKGKLKTEYKKYDDLGVGQGDWMSWSKLTKSIFYDAEGSPVADGSDTPFGGMVDSDEFVLVPMYIEKNQFETLNPTASSTLTTTMGYETETYAKNKEQQNNNRAEMVEAGTPKVIKK